MLLAKGKVDKIDLSGKKCFKEDKNIITGSAENIDRSFRLRNGTKVHLRQLSPKARVERLAALGVEYTEGKPKRKKSKKW